MASYTDPDAVEALVKNAIGFGSTPELDSDQIEALVAIAMPGGTGTSETLQRAAVAGWGWKAGLTSDQYDLKAASGATLTRSQWFDQCLRMAAEFGSGALSVDGEAVVTTPSRGGVTSVTLTRGSSSGEYRA